MKKIFEILIVVITITLSVENEKYFVSARNVRFGRSAPTAGLYHETNNLSLMETNNNSLSQIIEDYSEVTCTKKASDRSADVHKTITIGFVSSFQLIHGEGAKIAGAIPYAVDKVNK